MNNKKVLIVMPDMEPRHELVRPEVVHDIEIIFQPYNAYCYTRIIAGTHRGDFEITSAREHLDDLHAFCDQERVTGVFSADNYPGCLFASILAQEKALVGPHVATLLHCSHKYLSRSLQQKTMPEATPRFWLIDPHVPASWQDLSFPLFIKPVKSSFSFLAGRVDSKDQLQNCLQQFAMPEAFLYHFNWFLRHYGATDYDASGLLAEELLSGVQVTVEGLVYEHEITILGVVDSIMYPHTISFARFNYPSALSLAIQQRMHVIATQAAQAFNLNNTLFNIEMMYNPLTDSIHIIEINPRMSSVFADLYEKIDGMNLYTPALYIAAGVKPFLLSKQGIYKASTSFVMRLFENKFVAKTPSCEQIQKVEDAIPDIRVYVHAEEGRRLGELEQDGNSFVYMWLNIGGRDEQDLQEKKEYCLKHLLFIFRD